VSEGRLILRDGRTLAWCEYGPPNGRPLLRFQGMPGSRYSRHPHEESYRGPEPTDRKPGTEPVTKGVRPRTRSPRASSQIRNDILVVPLGFRPTRLSQRVARGHGPLPSGGGSPLGRSPLPRRSEGTGQQDGESRVSEPFILAANNRGRSRAWSVELPLCRQDHGHAPESTSQSMW